MKILYLTAIVASSVFAVANSASADDIGTGPMHPGTDAFSSYETILSDEQIDTITAGSHQYANIRIDFRYIDENGIKKRYVYRFKGKVKHGANKGPSKNVRNIVRVNKVVLNNTGNATVRQVNSSGVTVIQQSVSRN